MEEDSGREREGAGTTRGSPGPRASVIIVSYRSENTIAATLQALGKQRFTDFETIVVDSSPGGGVEDLVRSRFPDVRVERSSVRLPPHAARNRGAELAGGELIVFTDADCAADRGWLAALVAAHARGHAVVGGAVEPADRGWVGYGMHICKFGPWMTGSAPGTRTLLPTANQSWTREAWERVGPFALLGWSGDTELCWRARAQGLELAFEPSAVVAHREEPAFASFWRERLRRGMAFGRLRTRVESWSRTRAALQALAAPAVPVVLLARALREAGSASRLSPALASAPISFLGFCAWALGDARAQIERACSSRP